MANTKANVSVGKPKIAGAVWRAPAGTAAPTDATTALSNSFICLGYVSEDGLTNSNTKDRETIKAWGGDIVLEPVTEHNDNFSFSLIESLNEEVLKTAHGDSNVTGTLATGITVTANADTEDEGHVYVVDMELRGGVKKRIVIPDGEVTEVGDVTYRDNEAIAYPVTLKAAEDEAGNTHYEYIKAS